MYYSLQVTQLKTADRWTNFTKHTILNHIKLDPAHCYYQQQHTRGVLFPGDMQASLYDIRSIC